MDIKFGLDTFGDMQVDDSGKPISAAQTIRNVVEEDRKSTRLNSSHT